MFDKCIFCNTPTFLNRYGIIFCENNPCLKVRVEYYPYSGKCDFYCKYNNERYIIIYSKNRMTIYNNACNKDIYAILLDNDYQIIITPTNYQKKLPLLLTFS